jgi:hypothetical protein
MAAKPTQSEIDRARVYGLILTAGAALDLLEREGYARAPEAKRLCKALANMEASDIQAGKARRAK